MATQTFLVRPLGLPVVQSSGLAEHPSPCSTSQCWRGPLQHRFLAVNGLQRQRRHGGSRLRASANESESQAAVNDEGEAQQKEGGGVKVVLDKDIAKIVRKTAATYAPGASKKQKNPAQPGTVLYTVFEVQAYVSLVAGALLSYNVIFPSNQPDIWRMLGMWSVWMLAIPSLRARDCTAREKEALNYLFLLIPLINVVIPVFWKSFAGVFTADCVALVGMYAWKMEWLESTSAKDDV